MAIKDIIIDDNFDLIIENGDFKVSESDQQHIQLICITAIGSFKNAPLMGVGIEQYISSSGQSESLKRAISVQLAADGYKVNEILTKGFNESFEYSIDAIRG